MVARFEYVGDTRIDGAADFPESGFVEKFAGHQWLLLFSA
jgi:hypothetical protein